MLTINTNAIIFNPATVNLSAYGLSSDTYTANMIAYTVQGDALNNIFGWMSKPIGELVMLDRQHHSSWWNIWGHLFTSLIENHGMESVISALESRGFAGALFGIMGLLLAKYRSNEAEMC